ncbi:putative leucine-rich repeat protein [Megavirus courdo7]|uniref:Putative leucine-rich repeat protein n=1 Tax=Megavirus courdo7 TaxID=1128135 RepID=H2EB92_9VIRU|nr:putative leucine-rich repeat protein [Megavirus courdo7]
MSNPNTLFLNYYNFYNLLFYCKKYQDKLFWDKMEYHQVCY